MSVSPKYNIDDHVKFRWDMKELSGTIRGVSFGWTQDFYYDIYDASGVRFLVGEPEIISVIVTPQGNATTAIHQHQWREHIGLVERFEYCTVCDEKRDTSTISDKDYMYGY